MRPRILFVCCVLAVLTIGIITNEALSQQVSSVKESPYYEVAEAKLQLVQDGVFDLHEGKSVDLTDKSFLLTFRNVESDYIYVVLGGTQVGLHIGDRYDLKWNFPNFFGSTDKCFLDFVDLSAPRGAPAVATFRLYCL